MGVSWLLSLVISVGVEGGGGKWSMHNENAGGVCGDELVIIVSGYKLEGSGGGGGGGVRGRGGEVGSWSMSIVVGWVLPVVISW